MSEAEKIIAEALRMEGLDAGGASPHGWRCEHPDRYPDYCQCVPRTATAVAAALRDAGMLTETEWEYSYAEKWVDDSGVYERRPFGNLEHTQWALKNEAERVEALNDEMSNPNDHIYGVIERRRVVTPGPWSPIPEGEST